MFRPHRPIFRRVHIAVHTTIGSVSVPFRSRAPYVVAGLGDCPLENSHQDRPETCRDPTIYTNKIEIVTSVGFSFHIDKRKFGRKT